MKIIKSFSCASMCHMIPLSELLDEKLSRKNKRKCTPAPALCLVPPFSLLLFLSSRRLTTFTISAQWKTQHTSRICCLRHQFNLKTFSATPSTQSNGNPIPYSIFHSATLPLGATPLALAVCRLVCVLLLCALGQHKNRCLLCSARPVN